MDIYFLNSVLMKAAGLKMLKSFILNTSTAGTVEIQAAHLGQSTLKIKMLYEGKLANRILPQSPRQKH